MQLVKLSTLIEYRATQAKKWEASSGKLEVF